MSDGRTYWWAKDSAWWRRELIIELLDEFGPAGPAVIDWLSCEAKAQNDAGRVKSGPKAIARGINLDLVTVSHVLSRSVTLSLLDDFQEHGTRFTCRISGWQADQDRGRAAARQAAARGRDKAESDAVEPTAGDEATVTEGDESRSVTESHAESPTGENSREELLPPLPPRGGRARESAQFEDRLKAWSTAHFPGAPVSKVQALVAHMRVRGLHVDADSLRAYATDNPLWALTAEGVAA